MKSLSALCQRSDAFVAFLVGTAVFLSRLPFLLPGYGMDPDAWRVAHTARLIRSTGAYTFSREPGYPVHELACALLVNGGPLFLNGATALASAVAAACLGLSLKRLNVPGYVLAAFALAFTPVVFIESTTTMDYLWAVAFLLASLTCVLGGRAVVAGLLLGFAVGCRPSSAVMVLPLGYLMARGFERAPRLRSALAFCAVAGATGFLCYVVVFAHERWSWDFAAFIEFHREYVKGIRRPPTGEILRRATLSVWGALGCAALVLAGVLALIPAGRWQRLRRPVALASAFAMLMMFALFAKLPWVPAYLIPAVPFAILWCSQVLERPAFAAVCSLLALSGWVDLDVGGIRKGQVFQDHAERVADVAFTERILSEARALDHPSRIVAGRWFMKVEALAGGRKIIDGVNVLLAVHDTRQITGWRQRGYALYFVPGSEIDNRFTDDIDLVEYGFEPLFDPLVEPSMR